MKADYDPVRGRISSHWKRSGDNLELEVTVPANTTAEVWPPTAEAESVTESGKPLADGKAVKTLGDAAGWTRVVECESGRYLFSIRTNQ